MLYHLLYPLKDLWFGFNIFKYITFRAAMGSITAFLFSVIIGPIIIRKLSHLRIGDSPRKEYVENLYELHKHKEGTPTMGGIIIILSILFSTLLWARLDNRFIVIGLISVLWLGIVGFVDDYIKLIKVRSRGLSATTKFIGQLLLGAGIALYLYFDPEISTALYVPFFKHALVNLGIFYILFVTLVIVGTSNAVNLTDGLDGLAIGCVGFIALSYSAISYLAGHIKFSGYLNIYYLPGSSELAVFCAVIAGSCLGFLWFNSYPATVFMGDTGSLPLGGAIGVVSVLIKKEILLLIIGGIFVAEVISVIMQVMSFKLFKRRVFLMAPLHHHFQLLGWPESKITIRFWIAAVILVFLGLATLKAM
ncbi:MAG: phospho-N-acetylmuramoyl-pentapeptide-transferase [Candidatus Omnitrophica bacterium]|nr:phospho-N-acetylmuramoyl-pentapeptide-transferase [Candidatus Omnitrophota bacterium]